MFSRLSSRPIEIVRLSARAVIASPLPLYPTLAPVQCRLKASSSDGSDYPLPTENDISELIKNFGLGPGGNKNAASELRDIKLEGKVSALFKQTLKLAREGDIRLHPRDMEAQMSLEEIKHRVTERLQEIHHENPMAIDAIVQEMFEKRIDEIRNESETGNAGTIRGTLIPPWKRDSIEWKSFFRGVMKDEVTSQEEPEEESSVTRKHPIYKRFPWLDRGSEHLEELDDPTTYLISQGMGRTKCFFCGPEAHSYPLEPMNVPLLSRFMTSAGYLKPRRQTFLCVRHHSRVTKTIKRARTLGLFSYKKGEFRILNPLDVSQDYEDEDMEDEDKMVDDEDEDEDEDENDDVNTARDDQVLGRML